MAAVCAWRGRCAILQCLFLVALTSAAPYNGTKHEAGGVHFHLHAQWSHLLRLRPVFPIPDAGQVLTLPLHPSETQHAPSPLAALHTVRLHDFYHPNMQDVEVLLVHSGETLVLHNGALMHGPASAGHSEELAFRSLQHTATVLADANSVQGLGINLDFQETQGANAALGRQAQQSSTAFGRHAGLAVDGNVHGHFSSGSVTHTGGRGADRSQPWWQVRLDSPTPVRYVRLFNRQLQGTAPEVQRVTSTLGCIPPFIGEPTFTLAVTAGPRAGMTQPILASAVAMMADEVGQAGSGSGPGESMQAALQELDFLGRVDVSVQPAPCALSSGNTGQQWDITFLAFLGDAPELQVIARSAGGGEVAVSTVRQGTANEWYNGEDLEGHMEGALFPCTVMVLSASAAAGLPAHGGLSEARAAASWWTSVPGTTPDNSMMGRDAWQEEVLVEVPAGVVGDVVRVQLEGEGFLSLAEVQVLQAPERLLSFHNGPRRLGPSSDFAAVAAISQRLQGAPLHGPWVLMLRDTRAQEWAGGAAAASKDLRHGAGSLGLWSAHVQLQDGRSLHLHPDVMLHIHTVPTVGKLYEANASLFDLPATAWAAAGTRGPQLVPTPGTEPHRAVCRAPTESCRELGVGSILSMQWDGGLVPSSQRLTVHGNALAVVYEPPSPDWAGSTSFQYTTVVNGKHSAPATAHIHVEPCKTADCGARPKPGSSPVAWSLWQQIHGTAAPQAGSPRTQWWLQE